jgi:hypothetical protein
MTLAHLVYRLASDPAFAAEFVKEPQATLRTSGFVLDDEATSAVLSMLGDSGRTHVLCSSSQSRVPRDWYCPQREA